MTNPHKAHPTAARRRTLLRRLPRPRRPDQHPHQRPAAPPHDRTPAADTQWSSPIPGAVPLLAGLDPSSAPPHPLIIEAAIGHSQTVTDPHARLAWASCAHTGSFQQRGPFDPMTRRAALNYATILSEQGHLLDAYRLHHHRLLVARILGRPDELITAQRHLAEARHAIGQCEQAAAEIRRALTLWQAHLTPCDEGPRTLASYAAILAGCGQTHSAMRVLHTFCDLLRTADLHALAVRIVAAERTHPPACRLKPARTAPPAATAQRLTDWKHALHRLTQPSARPSPPSSITRPWNPPHAGRS
jgi:hypothetical protein